MKNRKNRKTPLPLPRFYFFALLFTLYHSPLSERLEQAKTKENEKEILSSFGQSIFVCEDATIYYG